MVQPIQRRASSGGHADYTGLAARVATAPGGLALAAGERTGTQVTLVDAPLPLPVVLAGPRPEGWLFDDAMSARFGGTLTPVRRAGTSLRPDGLGVGRRSLRFVSEGRLRGMKRFR